MPKMSAVNTLAGVFRPNERISAVIYDVIIVVCASIIVGLSAQIKVFIPFSPVPVTGQTFAVLILGALLGARRGALAMLAYLGEGALGLGVFAAGIGPATIIGPTGGYLAGFVAAAYLVGNLAEKGWDKRVVTTVAAMVLGNIVIHVFGFAWLTILTDVRTALLAGVCPFIVGDILKVLLAAVVLPGAWKLLGRLHVTANRC